MYLKRVERVWLKCERYRMRQDALIEHSLQNYTMAGLLVEQEDADAVVTDLNAAADEANTGIDDLLNRMPQKMGTARDALNKAKADIATNRLKTGITLPSLMGGPMEQLSRLFGNVQILKGSIANAFNTVAGALGDLGASIAASEDDRDKSLGDLIDLYSAGEEAIAGVPTKQDFEKSIISQLKAPEGLFKGLGQGFSNLMGSLGLGGGRDVGFGLKQQDFVDDMMTLTPNELDQFLKGSQAALDDAMAPSDDDPVQQIDDIISSAGLDDEVAPAGGADEGAPEEADDLVTITQGHLKNIKGAMDKAKGKKKSQSRALGGALNQILGGTPVFAEGKIYTYSEVKSILKENISSRNSYGEPYYDEDELVRRRWLRMAGLKDE